MTAPYYLATPGYPDLGFRLPLAGGWSIGTVLYPAAWALYLLVLMAYSIFQLRLWRQGRVLNGSKLLYMALIVPLHLVAFSHPLIAVFLVPIVTVGHNIQYHCIVWAYGRHKYPQRSERCYRWARFLFRNFAVYAATGLGFTFLLYRGPWIDWLTRLAGIELDNTFLNTFSMMAGVADPATLGLGEQLLAASLLGFAMQHYYLDAKIWRVSRDREVREHLGV